METSNIHTQNLIEKLTEHFYGAQFSGSLQDKTKMQDQITNLLNKASAAVPPKSDNVWTTQAVDVNYTSSTPMDESPNSSPIPFAPRSDSSSPCYSSDDDSFGQDIVLPSIISDLPAEFFEKKLNQNDSLHFDNEADMSGFFSHPFGLMNFGVPMTPPFNAIRPLSRYSSRETCPVIAPLQVISDVPQINILESIAPPPPAVTPSINEMQKFPSDGVVDFKHVIYNLLVDNFNNPSENNVLIPITMEVLPGVFKEGFKFNEKENPDKKLPELYAQHIRKADLRLENQNSVFIQDLYKFYLRACVELLSKYFVKFDKYTFLYDDTVLFIAGGALEDAEKRISKMGTIQRRQKRNQTDDFVAIKKSRSKRGSGELSGSTTSTDRRKKSRV